MCVTTERRPLLDERHRPVRVCATSENTQVRPGYVGRTTMASTAEGYGAVHDAQQKRIIDTALGDELSAFPFGVLSEKAVEEAIAAFTSGGPALDSDWLTGDESGESAAGTAGGGEAGGGPSPEVERLQAEIRALQSRLPGGAGAGSSAEGGPAAAVKKVGSAVNAGFTLVRARQRDAVRQFLADVVRRGLVEFYNRCARAGSLESSSVGYFLVRPFP